MTSASHPCRRGPRALRIGAGLCLALLAGPAALAAPYVPADDSTIVATVPRRSAALAPTGTARVALAPTVAPAPGLGPTTADLPQALARARQAIDAARRDGDPRPLGLAQAALAPWWSQAEAPPAVRLLRAVIRQSLHDFDAARVDLDALTRTEAGGPDMDRASANNAGANNAGANNAAANHNPTGRPEAGIPLALRAQAHLTRAAVRQVLGRYREAEADCAALAGPTYSRLGPEVAWFAEVCRADLAGLQGRADAADARLARLAAQAPASQAAWLALLRAEGAERRGSAQAEAHFRAALAGDDGVYVRAAYADWLLAEGRAGEVIRLLADRAEADALLLRLAIAYRRAGDARADAAVQTLRRRYEEAALRGDAGHEREQARFALEIDQRPAEALRLAQANWARQKEPADARLLAAAARAAGQPAALEPLRRFLREQGLRDARLGSLS